MDTQEIIKAIDNFLLTDIDHHPVVFDWNTMPIKAYTFVNFDIKNSIPVSKIPYFKIKSIDQAKEIFKIYWSKYQGLNTNDDYDYLFELNLGTRKFDKTGELYFSVFYDNRDKSSPIPV